MNIQKRNMKVTNTIIVINVIIYLLSLVGILTPSFMGLHPASVSNGQIYRLFTNMFSHFGLIHLVCNMYALFSFGMLLEPMLGSSNFLGLYICSGVLGSVFIQAISSIFNMNILAAGASGALFGLAGFMLYASKKLKGIGGGVVRGIVISLILSSIAGGSLLCHVCGLVAGVIVSPLVYNRNKR